MSCLFSPAVLREGMNITAAQPLDCACGWRVLFSCDCFFFWVSVISSCMPCAKSGMCACAQAVSDSVEDLIKGLGPSTPNLFMCMYLQRTPVITKSVEDLIKGLGPSTPNLFMCHVCMHFQ